MTSASEWLALIATRGTDDDGMTAYAVDPAGGALTRLGRTPAAAPGYLATGPDGDLLVATERVEGGRVSSWRVDRTDGSLERLGGQPSGGEGPCYASVDASGRYAFTTNYYGGTLAMFPIDDEGRLGAASHVVRHEATGPHPERQAQAHPHCVVSGPENRLAYVTDLGGDRIAVYRIDFEVGRLEDDAVPDVDLPAGSGPRHLAFGPDGRYAYVVNELDSTITALERDAETGTLDPVATASTLPPDADSAGNKPADVHVHPSGRWVYASNRGHDSVAIFEADGGTLRPLEWAATLGEWPRDFALDPTGGCLLAENGDSHEVVPFTVGPDGGLEPTGQRIAQEKPSCAVFVERDR